MSNLLASVQTSVRRELDVVNASVKQHRIGFVLPGVVLLVEFAMIPTRLLAGPQEPASDVREEEREEYYRKRALKIDTLVCLRVLLAVLALLFTPQNLWGKCVVVMLWLCSVTNIVAAVIHYGIVEGRPARVFSIPRVIVLSLLNYLEVILWFAVIFATCGRFNVGHLGPLDAIYFSGATVFTVGYGDIVPLGGTRLLALLEVSVGVLILVILIGRMLGSASTLGEYARKITPRKRE